jgi:hypothetical protein
MAVKDKTRYFKEMESYIVPDIYASATATHQVVTAGEEVSFVTSVSSAATTSTLPETSGALLSSASVSAAGNQSNATTSAYFNSDANTNMTVTVVQETKPTAAIFLAKMEKKKVQATLFGGIFQELSTLVPVSAPHQGKTQKVGKPVVAVSPSNANATKRAASPSITDATKKAASASPPSATNTNTATKKTSMSRTAGKGSRCCQFQKSTGKRTVLEAECESKGIVCLPKTTRIGLAALLLPDLPAFCDKHRPVEGQAPARKEKIEVPTPESSSNTAEGATGTTGTAQKKKRARAVWTSDEDTLVLKEEKRIGHKWSDIAKQLPGKSVENVRNRFHALTRISEIAEREAEGVTQLF